MADEPVTDEPAAPSRRRAMVLAWIALPLFATTYQILAKRLADAATRAGPGTAWLGHLVFAPAFTLLVVCEIASFALWMYILARMKLSEAFPLSAISYVLVVAASWGIFHEKATVMQLVGSIVVVLGVWLIARGEVPAPAS